MITAMTTSAAETRALAGAIAELVLPGDVLLLGGDLGAGKTTFTQGFGAALGVKEPVTSPTFTLVRPYDAAPGRPSLLHVDIYRLDQLAEVVDLGLAELVEEDMVAVVEWGVDAAPAFGPDHLEIQLTLGEEAAGEDVRIIRIQAAGHRWLARVDALRGAIAAWVEAA